MRLIKGFLMAVIFALSSIALADGCYVVRSSSPKLTIEKFVDFQCGYCADGEKTLKKILSAYPDQVTVIVRNLPLPMHKKARHYALAFAAVCNAKPEVAGAYYDALFADPRRRQGDENFVYELAEKFGIDTFTMKQKMGSGYPAEESVKADEALAKSKGIWVTPTYIIGNVTVKSANEEQIKKAIDSQLGK